MTLPERIHLARRCWVTPEQAQDFADRCLAVLETCAADSVVSSVSAGRLHGLWLPGIEDLIHIATATPGQQSERMTRTRRPQFRPHRHHLQPSERSVVDGVPSMSLERTWLDLGRCLTLPDLVAAGDSALRLGADVIELEDLLRRSVHVPGVVRARQALPLLDPRSRSRPESHLRLAVQVSEVPLFEVNEPIYRAGGRGWLAEPDLSLSPARLAIEYVGEDHGRIGRRRKDISRTLDLQDERWTVLEYGPAEVFGSPWRIGPRVRRLVRELSSAARPRLMVR